MKIGAHVSSAGSLSSSFDRACEIGAECTQIFISAPQQWAQVVHREREIEEYRKKQNESGIGPNFIHGAYLINLATGNPQNLRKSVEWLIYSQKEASRLGMVGTIFHLGSHLGAGFEEVKKQVCNSLANILSQSAHDTMLILENSAGAGGAVGSKFSEIGELIQTLKDKRLKVCLDTQHAFAAGYDMKTQAGLKSTFEEFGEKIGLGNLAVLHVNDSKTELKSGKDRHENIGNGFIGIEGFKNLLALPEVTDIPCILEVPGFKNKGPDKENLTVLKKLASGQALSD